MSQKRDLFNLIEKQSLLKGMVLRPLSAKLLQPTIPELNGWVIRENLYDLSGRSRKKQFGLVDEFAIDKYLTPSGGCLLTNPSFCRRLKELMKHNPDFDIEEVNLLKIGRHLRLANDAKLVVARTESECNHLERYFDGGYIRFIPHEIIGPLALGIGRFTRDQLKLAANIVACYCKKSSDRKIIKVLIKEQELLLEFNAIDCNREKIRRFLI
jgi:hypothetical protein